MPPNANCLSGVNSICKMVTVHGYWYVQLFLFQIRSALDVCAEYDMLY